MATTETGSPDARLILPGSGSRPARVQAIYQSRATRITRSLLTLALTLVIAPVSFFAPPHLLWPLLTLSIGGYLSWRYWNGAYYVIDFEGQCPRCETPLEVEEGTRIRRRQTLECYGCHRSPELVIEAPGQ